MESKLDMEGCQGKSRTITVESVRLCGFKAILNVEYGEGGLLLKRSRKNTSWLLVRRALKMQFYWFVLLFFFFFFLTNRMKL